MLIARRSVIARGDTLIQHANDDISNLAKWKIANPAQLVLITINLTQLRTST
jgi:hypothetical protein